MTKKLRTLFVGISGPFGVQKDEEPQTGSTRKTDPT